MNWAWAASLDRLWDSPAFPMWMALAAAGLFAIILLVTLARAEKSVANGVLTVITLGAIGIAVATSIRGSAPGRLASDDTRSSSSQPMSAALPALSCIDDLAGDTVLTACEKALFGSAESVAAAVSYAASAITRLTEVGDAAAADKRMTPQLQRLRRAVERDRYGLMAQVLVTRDHCIPTACTAFRALTDTRQIVANMDQRVYDGLIARYAPSWNMPAAPLAPMPAAALSPGPVAALPPGVPTGRPTNAEFPTAASTPAVSIMTPEPVGQAAARLPPSAPGDNARLLSPRPTASVAPALAAAKKQAAAKSQRPAAPIQLEPAAPAAGTPAPTAANESSFQKP